MSNWRHIRDGGVVEGTDVVHPLEHPRHPLNTGHDERKRRAMTGAGAVSRNDVALDHKGKAMPWDPVQLYYPEHPPQGTYAGERVSEWNTLEHSVEWNTLQYAPDTSRYATPNEGRLGNVIAGFFSYKNTQ
jgi:hypothetical protein